MATQSRRAFESDVQPEVLRTPDAAIYVGVTKAILDRSRASGIGPPFVRLSHRLVGYRRCDLDAWLASRTYASKAEEKYRKATGA